MKEEEIRNHDISAVLFLTKPYSGGVHALQKTGALAQSRISMSVSAMR